MAAVAMGTVIGYSAPSIPMMKTNDKPVRITSDQADWFGSLMNIGALFGGPIGGKYIMLSFSIICQIP